MSSSSAPDTSIRGLPSLDSTLLDGDRLGSSLGLPLQSPARLTLSFLTSRPRRFKVFAKLLGYISIFLAVDLALLV